MQFINFLYANTQLNPAPGDEDIVQPIHAYRGKSHMTARVQFSDEELAEIQKTGGVWLSMMQPPAPATNWPPVSVDAFIPYFQEVGFTIFGDHMIKEKPWHILYYLDLCIVVMDVLSNEDDFAFKLFKDGANDGDGAKLDLWDLQYKTQGSDEFVGDKYLFGELFDIAGRLKDIPRLQPLKFIYPMLRDDHLILFPRPKTPPPPILNMDGERLN